MAAASSPWHSALLTPCIVTLRCHQFVWVVLLSNPIIILAVE